MTTDVQGTGERALLRLFAHDLRAPLGPAVLGVSAIADDPSVPAAAREMASFAEGQMARLGRIIDAVVWASRRPRALNGDSTDLPPLVADAIRTIASIGVRCGGAIPPCRASVHQAALRGAIAGLLEGVAGNFGAEIGGRVEGGVCTLTISGPGWSAVGAGLDHEALDSAEAALSLGARAVFEAHGGGIEVAEGLVRTWIPVDA